MNNLDEKIFPGLFDALDKSSQSIFYVIQNGHFVYVNAYGCRIAGIRNRTNIFGRHGLTYVHPDDRILLSKMTKKVMAGEKIDPFEWRVHSEDGNTFWVMGSIVKIDLDGKPALLGNSMDITHLKQGKTEAKSSHKKVKDLTIDLDSVRNEERLQIAWELQENLDVTLNILSAEIEDSFDEYKINDKSKDFLIHRVDSVRKTISRAFKHLKPLNNDHDKLRDGIKWYLGELQNSTGILMNFDFPQSEIFIGKKQSSALFNIFQETIKTLIKLGDFSEVDTLVKAREHCLSINLKIKAKELKTNSSELISPKFEFLQPKIREWNGSLEVHKERQGVFVSIKCPFLSDKPSNEVKILLGSRQPILMDSLSQMISCMPDLFITEKSKTFLGLKEKAKNCDINMALIDSSVLGIRATDKLKEIKQAFPHLPILIYHTAKEDDDFAVRIIRNGASGYLSRSSSTNELISAIHRVAGGRKHISNRLAEELAFEMDIYTKKPLHHKLSDRERQVMLMVAQGMNMKSIAADLCLSYTTIVTYRNRVFEKLNMQTNTEIVKYAVSKGLI